VEYQVYSGLLLLAAASASVVRHPAYAERTELKLAVITQQTPVWCWAATASMALRQLGFPDLNLDRNYQCGVVAVAFDGCEDDCTKCVMSLGSIANLVGILDKYRNLSAEQAGFTYNGDFDPNYASFPGWNRVKRSLDLSFPVIGGISPDRKPDSPGQPKHTVLITGYDEDYRGTGEEWVIVRDPYPYGPGASPMPAPAMHMTQRAARRSCRGAYCATA
jgi:hypothetical protein